MGKMCAFKSVDQEIQIKTTVLHFMENLFIDIITEAGTSLPKKTVHIKAISP